MAKPIIHRIGPSLINHGSKPRLVVTGENLGAGYSLEVVATNGKGTRICTGHTYGAVENTDAGLQRIRAIVTNVGDWQKNDKKAIPKSDDDLAAITVTVTNHSGEEEEEESDPASGDAVIDV